MIFSFRTKITYFHPICFNTQLFLLQNTANRYNIEPVNVQYSSPHVVHSSTAKRLRLLSRPFDNNRLCLLGCFFSSS